MGYTHYWHRKRDLSNGWSAFIKDVRYVYRHLPMYSITAGGYYRTKIIKICGGMGVGDPVFNEDEVWFNGDKERNLDHETFYLPRIYDSREWGVFGEEPDENGYYFDWCKTARKPYDLLVCCVLILAKIHFGAMIKISSDGTRKDWNPAFKFMQHLGFKIPRHLLEH